jgi:precorrin-6A/cobalt-precorrin-6A reductase
VNRTRVLLLAGSTEASAMARALDARVGYDVTVSFAGRTRTRVDVPGAVRVGGFGGVEGLVAYLRAEQVDVVVDATHPFAATMPHHAKEACRIAEIAGVRVCRPPWTPTAGDRWHPVPDLAAAAVAIASLGGRRVFLTTGRQELEPFAHLDDVWFLVRAIEPPDPMPLHCVTVILDRGPFAVDAERALLVDHDIELVVSKNSGGTATAAKLVAARELGLPVVMVDRPAPAGLPTVATTADALAWLAKLDQAELDQAELDQAELDQAGLDQAG